MGLVAASCVRAPANDTGPPANEVATAVEAAAAEPMADRNTTGWQLGRLYAYNVKLSSRVAFGESGGTLELNLESHLDVVPTEVTPEAVTLHLAMRGPRIGGGATGSRDSFTSIARELEASSCFFVLSGGRLREMRFPRGMSTIAANTYRSVGSGLQFSRSTDNASRYSAIEYDTTGRYAAQYEYDASRGLWSKRKERYLELLGNAVRPLDTPAPVVPTVALSEGSIRLTAEGSPADVSLRDEVVIRGSQVPMHSKTWLSLQSAPSEPLAPHWQDARTLFAEADRIAADEPYGVASSPEALDDARIGALSFGEVVSALESMGNGTSTPPSSEPDRDEKAVQEKARLFIALCAIFRKNPDVIPLAVTKIRAQSSAASVLVSALGSASTAAAEQALLELSRSRSIGADLRNHVINALGQSRRPGAGAIESMKSMLADDPFSPRVLYGLGTYARHLRDQGKTREAADIGEMLLARLQAASTTSSTITVLRAISNAGYRPALGKLTSYLEDERDLVRATAVRAVQSMPGPEPDDVIASHLHPDASVEVRLSAIAAARARTPSNLLVGALVDAATKADSPHVRYRAVELMGQWLVKRPDLGEWLKRVAERDQEPRIRERAKAVL